MPLQNTWDFCTRATNGGSWSGVPLTLSWFLPEAAGISDNNTQDDMSARQALKAWLERLDGAATLPISWAVSGEGIFEKAPFCPHDEGDPRPENFLTHFTWPVHALTGERLRFTGLPVADETWEHGISRGKAGFVQAATGWKPSPLQQTMDLEVILAATGF